MKNRLLGCTLLVIGTSIGGGMLALPVVTAAGGLWRSGLLLGFSWLVMTAGALLMAEVCLRLHRDNNLVSMARATLGRTGAAVAWLTYLGLLYALMAAYISGGSGVLQSLSLLVKINLGNAWAALIFTVLLGWIVWRGVHMVDKTNRALMSLKLLAFIGLIVFIAPHVQWVNWQGGSTKPLFGALTVALTSFGFAGSIPTFCSYLNYDRRQIRLAVWAGSGITLLTYLIWETAVQGAIHADSLTSMATAGNTTELLTAGLSEIARSHWISSFAHVFTSICMLTSFIGVSLGLSDFLADGLAVKKAERRWLVYGITFIPPLAITLIYPKIFVIALSYAGIFCLILLMLLPGLMAWRQRYHQQHTDVCGNKGLLGLEIAIAVALILFAIGQRFL